MKINLSKTREQFPLSVKKIYKKTFVNSIVWVIILLIAFAFVIYAKSVTETTVNNGFYNIVSMFLLTLLFIIIAINYLYQLWYFNVYYYDLTSDYIIIKKGPITPREINIPYERIQDIYVDQDIFDRIFGIYDVHLSSATISSGMEAHIDGVEKPASEGLRNLLLNTVQNKLTRQHNMSSSEQ